VKIADNVFLIPDVIDTAGHSPGHGPVVMDAAGKFPL